MCDVAHHAMTLTTVKQAGARLVYKKKPIANIMVSMVLQKHRPLSSPHADWTHGKECGREIT